MLLVSWMVPRMNVPRLQPIPGPLAQAGLAARVPRSALPPTRTTMPACVIPRVVLVFWDYSAWIAHRCRSRFVINDFVRNASD